MHGLKGCCGRYGLGVPGATSAAATRSTRSFELLRPCARAWLWKIRQVVGRCRPGRVRVYFRSADELPEAVRLLASDQADRKRLAGSCQAGVRRARNR